MRQLAALLSFCQNGSASDHFRRGKRGRKSESSKQACIAQAVRPAVSRGLVCPETRAVGYLCLSHGLSSPLWNVAAQPCGGRAAGACVRTSEPLWARSPTRIVPGLQCRQSHLRQRLDPVLNRSQETVLAAIHRARSLFPFQILRIDTDNGVEFIKRKLLRIVSKYRLRLPADGPIRKEISALSRCATSALSRLHLKIQEVENNYTS
jgi:hypothetical protein